MDRARIVYGIFAASAVGALAYQRFTNPDAVRDQIIIELERAFPGAEVSVDSAHLRILGGIQLNGLRLCRGDDPDKHEFLQVPSAIFYHDKEKILDGELRAAQNRVDPPTPAGAPWSGRQMESRRPGEAAQPVPDKMLPAIVIHQGTVDS